MFLFHYGKQDISVSQCPRHTSAGKRLVCRELDIEHTANTGFLGTRKSCFERNKKRKIWKTLGDALTATMPFPVVFHVAAVVHEIQWK